MSFRKYTSVYIYQYISKFAISVLALTVFLLVCVWVCFVTLFTMKSA
jgi:hypothetical protein